MTIQIDVTGFSGENLTLELRGRPNSGLCAAKRGDEVRWNVMDGSGVKNIEAISMKQIAGNVDVFSSSPLRASNPHKKNWKAEVNNDAENFAVYVYNITWIKESDDSSHIFDPIISIRPKIIISLAALAAVCFTAVAAITYLGYKYFSLKNGH